MNTRKEILAIGTFLLLVLAVWLGVSALPTPKLAELPMSGGVSDLRGEDFTDTVYVPVGAWNSYPEKLYTPADLVFRFKDGTEIEG